MGGRALRWLALVAVEVSTLGCGKPAVVASAPPPNPRSDWPKDTLERPEFLSVVDRVAGHVKGDAEAARIPSTYKIPDWAEPTSSISVNGPKGAKLSFHLLPRAPAQKKADDAHVKRLLAGKPDGAEQLVVARPWIGWFGQSSGVEALANFKSRPYALRVYTLFDDARQLEVHVEWPTGDKEAFEEGQELLAHVVYSVQPQS